MSSKNLPTKLMLAFSSGDWLHTKGRVHCNYTSIAYTKRFLSYSDTHCNQIASSLKKPITCNHCLANFSHFLCTFRNEIQRIEKSKIFIRNDNKCYLVNLICVNTMIRYKFHFHFKNSISFENKFLWNVFSFLCIIIHQNNIIQEIKFLFS